MDTKTALKKVRSLIKKGWCTKSFTKKIGKVNHYCLYGACLHHIFDDNIKVKVINFMQNSQLNGNSIITFNDSCKRKEQVLKFLDNCIAKAEGLKS